MMPAISLFRSIENNHDVSRGKDFVNSEKKKKMKLLTKKPQKLYRNANICYICKENVKLSIMLENAEVLHIAYVIYNIVCLKKYIVFHNGSNYDYNFIIKS